MSYGRMIGFMWGIICGAAMMLSIFMHPSFLGFTSAALLGCYLFRSNDECL